MKSVFTVLSFVLMFSFSNQVLASGVEIGSINANDFPSSTTSAVDSLTNIEDNFTVKAVKILVNLSSEFGAIMDFTFLLFAFIGFVMGGYGIYGLAMRKNNQKPVPYFLALIFTGSVLMSTMYCMEYVGGSLFQDDAFTSQQTRNLISQPVKIDGEKLTVAITGFVLTQFCALIGIFTFVGAVLKMPQLVLGNGGSKATIFGVFVLFLVAGMLFNLEETLSLFNFGHTDFYEDFFSLTRS